MWVGCTFWILVFAFHSLLCFSVHWVKVHVDCGHCFWTAPERVRLLGESLTTGDHYWSGVCLKEVGMKGGRFEEGDGVRLGWETGKNQWPGHALTLTRMRSEIWLFSFDPENKAPAGGLRICPLPNASFPLLSQRYHWLVPMWIRVLVFTLYECLYLDNSLFCVATQKIKKLLVGSSFLDYLWLVFPSLASKTQPEWELNILSWPRNKSPRICSTRSVYLSCDSAEMGLWIWILSGSGVLAAVAGPRPWQPCWINSFQKAGLKNEKRSRERKPLLI